MTATTTPINTKQIQQIFQAQLDNHYKVAESSAKERIQKLQKLSDTIMKYRSEIRQAMWKDYRKPAAEVDLTEIFILTHEVKHIKSNLRRWMASKRVGTPLSLFGSSSWIQYEPKGVCLIISPWNYPMQLGFGPMISAIAAGNTVILKPSEHAPNCTAMMRKIIEEIFETNEVAIVEGEVDTATELLRLPFNHIFFTGSPEVGKIVMAAAAKNLASVTLELGGKSPTIVDETADLNSAAARIVWSKFSNNGQMCIAPDYVFVHESKLTEFVVKVKANITKLYGEKPQESPDYMRLINVSHCRRVKSYLENSVAQGAKVVHGGHSDADGNYMEPTVVTDVPLGSDLMQKEIFGPIMPIITYKNLQETIDLIRSKEIPLALYIYSKNSKNINRILRETRAGGTCINNSALHFFNANLPFGGSNNSGIGKAHGWYGFEAFSNARGVYKQVLPSALDMLMPPYNNFKMKLIDLTIKWF